VVIGTPDPTVAALLEEALTELPDDERATRARLRARLAVEVCYADPPRAKELSRQAVTGARAASDAAALATALNARRVALWSPAHLDERLDAAEAMVTAAKAAGDRESVLQGHNWRVVDLMELGRFDAVAAAIDEYDVLAGAVGLPHYRWYAPLWRACLAQLAGRWTDSVALTEQALALGLEADDPNAPLLVRLQSLHALVHQRRFSDIDRAWIAERAADPLAGVAWMAGLALLDAELGDLDAARRVISRLTRDRCVAVPTNANWHVACLLSEAAVRVADPAAAAALYELLVPYARLFPVVARGISCYGSTEYFLGRLAATLGRLDEAEARLRRATTENDRAGAAPHAALALVSLGEVLAARAKHAEARDAMAEAAARAHALHLRAVAAQAHHSLDGARPL
jgi:tetratricopeptide (TPR) repeat protein